MTNEEIMAGTALASWTQMTGFVTKMLASYTDADMDREVAPGKNRIRYIIGHLAAVNDGMLSLLRLGPRLHQELDEEFLKNPDRLNPDKATNAEIRAAWNEIQAQLNASFAALKPAEWLERHTSVSEDEFAKQPLRNRLAVLLSRTAHVAMHGGQLRLVKF